MLASFRTLIRPYVLIGTFSVGSVLGGTTTWLLASPPDPIVAACRSDSAWSRAHYITATHQLSPAWGSWNVAIMDRNDAVRSYKLLIGIDTKERCEAAAKQIDAHGAKGMCFESVATKGE